MNSVKLFKKFFMPCGLCAAVPLAKPVSQKEAEPHPHEQEKKQRIRPSELPIYSVEDHHAQKAPCPEDCPPSYIEQGFGTIRRSLRDLRGQLSGYTGSITSKIDTGLEHSQLTLEYLREESNTLPRLGAVGIGGLTGLIFGLRGGKFKRMLYSSTGAITIAAVCYPRQAKESLQAAKHYANIGYNFVYGVKPGDANQLEIQWPDLSSLKVPSSLSEVSDVAVGAGSAVVGSISAIINATTGNSEQSESKPAGAETKKEK